MATTYQSWSVVFGEIPSAAKWNILGTNDAGFNNGTALPVGSCVQIASSLTSAVSTGTTLIPFDDTIPQNTEGDQYMTLAITPRSATNTLLIESTVFCSSSLGSNNITAALFQDTTANALSASSHTQSVALTPVCIKVSYYMTAGTTSSTTFKIRVGGSGAGTTTFNGSNGARIFSTMSKSSIVIREYTV